MEIYTLNRFNRIDGIVEGIESFIWTERYSAYGDFQMVMPSTATNVQKFIPGVRLVHSLSDRVMTVKTVEKVLSPDGKKTLEIKGLSLESFLLDKVARRGKQTYPYNWVFSRTPSVTIRTAVREILIDGLTELNDRIDGLTINETPRPGSIVEPIEPINNDWKPQPLYDPIKLVADTWDLGFCITRNNETGVLVFECYTGYNRTSSQTTNEAVIFSASLDNLTNTREIKSNVDYKNVVLIYSEQRSPIEVYATGTTSSTKSEARRVIAVEASKLDGTPTEAQLLAHFHQEARQVLAAHRMVELFDGEISQFSPYVYGRDYGLGDLVEFQNDEGGANVMMVTEQIFALDGQGLRSYPTLTLHTYIQPGSWLAWDQNKEWDDLTTEEWNTMP